MNHVKAAPERKYAEPARKLCEETLAALAYKPKDGAERERAVQSLYSLLQYSGFSFSEFCLVIKAIQESKDVITSEARLKQVVEVARAYSTPSIFCSEPLVLLEDALPAAKGIITSDERFGKLMELAKFYAEHRIVVWPIIQLDLPKAKELLANEECFDRVLGVAKSLAEVGIPGGIDHSLTIGDGLPLIKDLVNSPEDITGFGEAFIQLETEHAGDKELRLTVFTGLEIAKGLIKSPEDVLKYGRKFADFGEFSKKQKFAGGIVLANLRYVKELLVSETHLDAFLGLLRDSMEKYDKQTGVSPSQLFEEGMPLVKHLIKSPEDILEYGRRFDAIFSKDKVFEFLPYNRQLPTAHPSQG